MERRWRAAVVTVSDRCAEGVRRDETGARLRALLEAEGYHVMSLTVVPDEHERIVAALIALADGGECDLIVTNGGTGVSPRDVTPEATRAVIEREIPGMAEAMRSASLRITSHAMLSRAVAGVRGKSLIINLPGSPAGAVENFLAVAEAVPHALEKIHGDPSECALPR